MQNRLSSPLHIALTIVVAYLSYALASQLGASGIFASATAGITLRSLAHLPPNSRQAIAIDRAWDAIAFAANAVVFALVGLSLRLSRLEHEPLLLGAVTAAVLIARVVLAYGLVPLRGLTEASRPWRHAIALAGLRGGLSLAIALGLPVTLAARDAIRDATFAVVFVTLILQGPLIAPFLARLPLEGDAGATSTSA
jgi:CPA1 family monovalent cation:H+ antiporter